MRTIKALSQRPSPCASNSNALTPARGQFLLHRRHVRQARTIQPIAGDLDEENAVLFPPSGQACGSMLQDHSCFSVVVRVEGQVAGGKVREDNADRNEGQWSHWFHPPSAMVMLTRMPPRTTIARPVSHGWYSVTRPNA